MNRLAVPLRCIRNRIAPVVPASSGSEPVSPSSCFDVSSRQTSGQSPSRGRCARRVAGEPLFPGLEEILRPTVIQVLDNSLAPAQFGDALLAAHARGYPCAAHAQSRPRGRHQAHRLLLGVGDHGRALSRSSVLLVRTDNFRRNCQHVVVAARFIWLYPATYLPRWLFPSIKRRDPSPPWQWPFVLAFTGVRGIVSLAAALAIPFATTSGQPFPDRDLILFLTFSVILVTLVGQGLLLPSTRRTSSAQPARCAGCTHRRITTDRPSL
jgi:hypothetical protein